MYIFPVHLFNPASVKAKPRARVIDGGTSLNGDSDAISADGGGRWYIAYSGIELRTPDLDRWWTQWDSYLLGGARAVLVPLLSLRTAPRGIAGGKVKRVSGLYTDDTVYPTVVRYASPEIVAVTVGNVGIRETVATINVTQGARIRGGETFSVGRRAYVIERVISHSGQVATVVFSPPARAAITNGASVNFEWPVVQAKLAIGQDLGGDFSFNTSTVSISFVEDFSDAS